MQPLANTAGQVTNQKTTGTGTWRRFLRYLALTVLGLLIAFAITASVLAIEGWRMVPILSGSMRPGLHPADLAFTKPLQVSNIKVGDVIAYRAPIAGHPLIIHRVISTQMQGSDMVVHTKGDANNKADDWETHFTNGQVLQKVRSVRSVGRAVHYVAEIGPVHMSMIIGVSFLGLLMLTIIWHPILKETTPTEALSNGPLAA